MFGSFVKMSVATWVRDQYRALDLAVGNIRRNLAVRILRDAERMQVRRLTQLRRYIDMNTVENPRLYMRRVAERDYAVSLLRGLMRRCRSIIQHG